LRTLRTRKGSFHMDTSRYLSASSGFMARMWRTSSAVTLRRPNEPATWLYSSIT
jgi:flagellar hook protein FlgE